MLARGPPVAPTPSVVLRSNLDVQLDALAVRSQLIMTPPRPHSLPLN